MGFTHLHVHTEYSLLDGASKIKELIHHTKELGMDSIAITDHGVMYGVIDFYKAAKAEGIKPIIGCEVYVAPGSRFDRELGRGENRYYHLVLLAENNLGYHNLMKLVSKGFTEGFYYKPRVDRELLEEYHEGLIALSACLAGEVATKLRQGFYEEAKKAASEHLQIFGEGNYFLELQDHGIGEQKTVNQGLMRLSQETGIPLVATNDIHYVKESDAEAHDILLCVQTQKKVTDADRMRYDGGQYYLKSEAEMEELFPYAKQALENTGEIAKRCNVEFEFGKLKLPKYEVPEGFTSESYLRAMCEEGMRRNYASVTEEIEERLNYELSTIEQMGFVDYFLIVWDYVKYAKDNGIDVGPGRGSAAGSIVSYCLGITDIDPIQYNLLFERFLNPERVSMPDIDVDFLDEGRQDVIDYVVRKYGREKVVQIGTFTTLAAKRVIQDVGKALDMSSFSVNRISNMIPRTPKITIDEVLENSNDLKKAYEEEEDVRYLIDMSKKLEGLPRDASTHASGVVISQEALDEFVPLALGKSRDSGSNGSKEDVTQTQFAKDPLEDIGLLKMDFLGLRTLTVIRNALKNIKQNRGIDVDLSVEHLDIEDSAVYDLLGTGETEGIFQLESSGMQSFMRELKPKSIEDIIAGIALYRPGPMDFIPDYIKGKEHPEVVTYDCPQLEEILAPTYGCIVYQEQVMQIVRDLAGYTMGRSDLVRRAMAKKKGDVMQRERQNFVYGNEEEGVPGCVNRGIDEATANKIFDKMIDFAAYAFNKSHAAAYGFVTYQTAYLKCHYPEEYMAALLTTVIDRNDKLSVYIAHCRKLGIQILPPDINESFGHFYVSGNSIRYGLSALKSVGWSVIDAIVEEREKNGPYQNLKDYVDRLSNKEVNKRAVENLIKAGSFDCFGVNRRQMMMVYLQVLDAVKREKKSAMTGQMSLMDFLGEEEKKDFDISYPQVSEYAKEELLSYEKEVLGVYVSGHPLEDYQDMMRKNITATTRDFVVDEESGETVAKNEVYYTMGGMIAEKREMLTKKNQQMAFIKLEDLFGMIEVVVFSKAYEQYRNQLEEDNKIFVYGRASIEEEGGKLLLDKVVPFSDVPKQVYVQCANKADFEKKQERIYEIVDSHSGKSEVFVVLKEENQMKALGAQFGVTVSEELLQEMKQLLGEGKVLTKEGKLSMQRTNSYNR